MTPVRTSWTDDELDVLDALAYLESVRGPRRSIMVRRIVEERLAYVMANDPQVRELVRLRREQRATAQGQQRFQIIEGGKP
jgi:hypothetical protein